MADNGGHDDDLPLPIVVDIHGRRIDPLTGRILSDGQENLDSIFYAPSNENSLMAPGYYHIDIGSKSISFKEMMKMVRDSGFRGQQVNLVITPDPNKENAPVPAPPSIFAQQSDSDTLYEVSRGNILRTSCGYCWAVSKGEQRPSGFTLQELNEAAVRGCEACNVLQKSIAHFASLLFENYSPRKVRVRQQEVSSIYPTGLLSQTDKVGVYFDEYGQEGVELDFRLSSQSSRTIEHFNQISPACRSPC